MLCTQLITKFQDIQSQRQELNQMIDGFYNSRDSQLTNDRKINYLSKLYKFRQQLIRLTIELKNEVFNPVIEVKNYIEKTNRPTQETEIKINFEKIIANTIKFYQKHEITLSQDFAIQAKKIWMNNYNEIRNEIATYGYDNVLIIPNNLPNLEELHSKMTAGYVETSVSDSFKFGGAFAEAKNSRSKDNAFRLVLTHNIQNLEDHVLLKATKHCSLESLTGNSESEIRTIVGKEGELLINFKLYEIKFGAEKPTKNKVIQAEGLTLAEYLIFQRQYFEANGKHLDQKGWTRLLATISNYGFLFTYWHPRDNNLYISPLGLYYSVPMPLGCRFSHSFT